MKPKVGFVDFGIGNFGSLISAFDRLGWRVVHLKDEKDFQAVKAIVLPGVGAFGAAMSGLKTSGLLSMLEEYTQVQKKPCLGICLGMQLMAESSEEGGCHKGLGWIPGHVKKMNLQSLPVPHVGWNRVKILQDTRVFDCCGDLADFYFDHSYAFSTSEQYALATSDYGGDFVCAVSRGSVFGVQFHPEKSQKAGLKFIRGFLNLALKSA